MLYKPVHEEVGCHTTPRKHNATAHYHQLGLEISSALSTAWSLEHHNTTLLWMNASQLEQTHDMPQKEWLSSVFR
jgi:hypothetical protein